MFQTPLPASQTILVRHHPLLRVTAVFFSGIRHCARAKNASSNGGISEVSISSSVMLSMRAQSVPECVFKLFALLVQQSELGAGRVEKSFFLRDIEAGSYSAVIAGIY